MRPENYSYDQFSPFYVRIQQSLGPTGSPTQLAQWGPENASHCFGSSPTGAWCWLPRPNGQGETCHLLRLLEFHLQCWVESGTKDFAAKMMMPLGKHSDFSRGPPGKGLTKVWTWIPEKNGDMIHGFPTMAVTLRMSGNPESFIAPSCSSCWIFIISCHGASFPKSSGCELQSLRSYCRIGTDFTRTPKCLQKFEPPRNCDEDQIITLIACSGKGRDRKSVV